MARKKHLTDLERLEIEHGLRHSLSLKKIAAKIGKHHSTVAREILARSVARGFRDPDNYRLRMLLIGGGLRI